MSWLLYGATGYTGELIAREAAHAGMTPILGGRNAARLEVLAKSLNLSARVIVLEDPAAIAASLDGVNLVLNCAGPFSRTAEPLVRACLARNVHYLDITGEIPVLERIRALHSRAAASKIVLCSGVGFDVVPTDCIALQLKEALPNATELSLGFDGVERWSRGTAKTALESLAFGGRVRRDGRLRRVAFGYGKRRIDFGRGIVWAMAIPWGDVSTAFTTTGIPNVTVYAPIPKGRRWAIRLLERVRFLFRLRMLRRAIERRIDAGPAGPTAAERALGRTWVWGEARAPGGAAVTIRIATQDPYALTVHAALGAVRRVLERPVSPGSTTPARLLGSGYVLELPETTLVPG